MARRTSQWFLSLQLTLHLLLIFVRGNEDAEDAYKNGRNLVLEYFLPINLPAAAVSAPLPRREKRDVEGSGEDETVFSEITERRLDEGDNSTETAFTKLLMREDEEGGKSAGVLMNAEGSGEVDELNSSEERNDGTGVPILDGGEMLTTTESGEEVETETPETPTAEVLTSTEMVFDKSEDFEDVSTIKPEETTTEPVILPIVETTTAEETTTEVPETTTAMETTTEEHESTTEGHESTTEEHETTTEEQETTTVAEETTTVLPITVIPQLGMEEESETEGLPTTTEATTLPETTTVTESTPIIPVVVPQIHLPEEPVVDAVTTPKPTQEPMIPPTEGPSMPKFATPAIIAKVTGELTIPPPAPTTPQPVVEEAFQETKIGKKLEAVPGNILQKENLSLAADPLLIANTRLMDSEENVQLTSSEPKRLGAYIVIGLILLSFSSLVGYITFRKRMNRKRQEFESNQESNDTEKALLSLSDYKDNSELEENHLKNNEITPIVVKSNSQINKFEKNTNFSSPKNLNTIANEKNIEKDNVLKSTAENLTQVIIEDSPKDVEEEKNVPNLEKLIVKTRIDQDSIPKKPIIINRSSTGYLPIPQDNS